MLHPIFFAGIFWSLLVLPAEAQSTRDTLPPPGARSIHIRADRPNRSFVTTAGRVVDIRLWNVGPGQYESPPRISSGVLKFIRVDIVPPFTPAGPVQRFRFRAVRSGQAIVTFKRSLQGYFTVPSTLKDSMVSFVEDAVQVHRRKRRSQVRHRVEQVGGRPGSSRS